MFDSIKDETLLFFVYYCNRYVVTKQDFYSLPSVEKYKHFAGEATVFSKFGIVSGYWQIDIINFETNKTAFIPYHASHRFIRMLFAQSSVHSPFQGTMEVTFSSIKWQLFIVYIINAVVFSKMQRHHTDHVYQVDFLLHCIGASLILRKCNKFTHILDYVEHVIDPGYLELAFYKIDSIRELKSHTTPRILPPFFAIYNVFCRNIPNFAQIAAKDRFALWFLWLSKFDFKVVHCAIFKHHTADALLQLANSDKRKPLDESILQLAIATCYSADTQASKNIAVSIQLVQFLTSAKFFCAHSSNIFCRMLHDQVVRDNSSIKFKSKGLLVWCIRVDHAILIVVAPSVWQRLLLSYQPPNAENPCQYRMIDLFRGKFHCFCMSANFKRIGSSC